MVNALALRFAKMLRTQKVLLSKISNTQSPVLLHAVITHAMHSQKSPCMDIEKTVFQIPVDPDLDAKPTLLHNQLTFRRR